MTQNCTEQYLSDLVHQIEARLNIIDWSNSAVKSIQACTDMVKQGAETHKVCDIIEEVLNKAPDTTYAPQSERALVHDTILRLKAVRDEFKSKFCVFNCEGNHGRVIVANHIGSLTFT